MTDRSPAPKRESKPEPTTEGDGHSAPDDFASDTAAPAAPVLPQADASVPVAPVPAPASPQTDAPTPVAPVPAPASPQIGIPAPDTPAPADFASPQADAPAPAPEQVRWWGMTDKGRFRANNEDAFLCVTLDSSQVYRLGKEGQGAFTDGDFVFAVSDGMGGAKAGEFASSIALDKITRLFPAAYRLGGAMLHEDAPTLLEELFQQIHAEMNSMSFHYEECRGMGATLSLGWFTAGRLHYAHVGDSRIYHLPQAGAMHQLSEDHTHVAWLLRNRRITPLEARTHPRRSQLEMVLGGNNRSIQPQIGSVPCRRGDRFLFCSDGINGGISDRVIEDLIRNPSPRTAQWAPAERLIREAAFASRDNMTAIVVEIV